MNLCSNPCRFQQLLEPMHRCFPQSPSPTPLKYLCRYGWGLLSQGTQLLLLPAPCSACDFPNPEIPHSSSKRPLHHDEEQQTTRGTFKLLAFYTFKINLRYAQFKKNLANHPRACKPTTTTTPDCPRGDTNSSSQKTKRTNSKLVILLTVTRLNRK